jgi:hypothetical protein
LKREFRAYLLAAHPEWSQSTFSTPVSGSFYAFNNNIGIDFWSYFINDESMIEARNRLRDFLLIEKQSDLADVRADEYMRSMKFFIGFLDEKTDKI